ncbi:MAG: anti-sigma regulatory factor [Planctomycetaceae bacterium]|nr:anti-sigma regulatory factor [Planctomycetaceae bacterium]
MTSSNHQFAKQETLPSSLAAYHDFVDDVIGRLGAAGWGDSDLFAIRMALEESISNAIRHGNREDPAKQVEVECRGDARSFWIRVCDEGDGFQPEDVPNCCDDDRLEVPGGRGLALMRAYMTKMQYNDRGNCLTMEKVRHIAS